MTIQLPFTVKWKRDGDTPVTLAKFHHDDDADLFAFLTSADRKIDVTVHEGRFQRRFVSHVYANTKDGRAAIRKLTARCKRAALRADGAI